VFVPRRFRISRQQVLSLGSDMQKNPMSPSLGPTADDDAISRTSPRGVAVSCKMQNQKTCRQYFSPNYLGTGGLASCGMWGPSLGVWLSDQSRASCGLGCSLEPFLFPALRKNLRLPPGTIQCSEWLCVIRVKPTECYPRMAEVSGLTDVDIIACQSLYS
jgi:hypothetical protein